MGNSTSHYGLDPDSDPDSGSNDSGDSDDRQEDISTVSTIFGISLFIVFAVSVLVRRLYIHRRIRILRSRNRARMLAAVRMGEWDYEYDEPHTIAIGARAALVQTPILWEDHMVPLNPHMNEIFKWDDIKPASLQLTTPHSTAHFPIRRTTTANTNRRASRRYSNFIFRNHRPPIPGTISASPIPSPDPNPDDPMPGKPKLTNVLYPHPVHVTFLISMPNPLSPTNRSNTDAITTTNTTPSILPPSQLQSSTHVLPTTQTNSQIEFGTTTPLVSLPSYIIPQAELDSYWDLPNIPSSRRRSEVAMMSGVFGWDISDGLGLPRPDLMSYPAHFLP